MEMLTGAVKKEGRRKKQRVWGLRNSNGNGSPVVLATLELLVGARFLFIYYQWSSAFGC